VLHLSVITKKLYLYIFMNKQLNVHLNASYT
jgi:hypothetical protein